MFKVNLEKYGDVRVWFQHRNPATMNFGVDLARNRVLGIKPGTDCIIAIDEKEGEWIGYAKTILNPKDTFEREKGRKYSLAQALRDLGLSREERRKVWDAYWNMGKGVS